MVVTRRPPARSSGVQYPLLAPLTDFASITPKTPLKTLNLNWSEKDLPESVRTKHVHRLHPYLGKFVPQLVEIFLRKYKPKVVCDPFCGSGTTLVEALALGINSIGCEVSEFNCLLARVKTSQYDIDILEQEIRDILQRALKEPQGVLMERQVHYEADSYLGQWYDPNALEALLAYRTLIPDYSHQDVLKIILSRAARSSRLTTHFDLDFPKEPRTADYYCYKHKRTCHPTTNAAQFLRRYSADTLKRIRAFTEIRTAAKVTILYSDAQTTEFPEHDFVVTSPPYVGLIDYHEQHRYAYELLGLNWAAEAEIGAATNGNSMKAKDKYVEEISRVFLNVKESLAPKGRVVVVVNDKFGLYPEIAERSGFKVEEELHRHVNRRTGRRADDFFESILIWKCR